MFGGFCLKRGLFLSFCLLVTYRLCFLRYVMRVVDRMGYPGGQNLVFCVYCAAIVTGMILCPLMLEKYRIDWNGKSAARVGRWLCSVAMISTVLLHFATGLMSLACQFLAMSAVAGTVNICLNRAVLGGISQAGMGQFLGRAFALMTAVVAIVFHIPGVDIHSGFAVALLSALLVCSVLTFPSKNQVIDNPVEESPHFIPEKHTVLKITVLICVFAAVTGILDNIFFFEDAFDSIPHFLFFIYLYESILYIAAGHLFDKRGRGALAAQGFLLICLGQSMSFFSQHNLLVYPYMIFSDAGNILLTLFAIALPMFYGAALRKTGIVPGMGYIILFVGFAVTSIMFEFIPKNMYKVTLGMTLILSLAAVYCTLSLAAEYERRRPERVLGQKQGLAMCRDKYSFTPKECEVLDYLSSGETTSEIAKKMFISERTVNFHIGSMLKKTCTRNRVELVSRVNERFVASDGPGI